MIIKDAKLFNSLTRYLNNVQDAEDAIQGAYLYQLTHRLKRKHFMWKAYNQAKSARSGKFSRDLVSKTGFSSLKNEASDQSSALESMIAKQEYTLLRARLSVKNQQYLDLLREHEGVIIEAAEASGISRFRLKTFMSDLRKGKL